MKKLKLKNLEAKGFKISTVSEFLNLTPEEAEEIERRLAESRSNSQKKILKKYAGFTAEISFSDDDKVFVGRVLDTKDIISFHGETLEEAIKEFHGMIDFHKKVSEQSKTKTID